MSDKTPSQIKKERLKNLVKARAVRMSNLRLKKNPSWTCPKCGSEDIQAVFWVWTKTSEIADKYCDTIYCSECDEIIEDE